MKSIAVLLTVFNRKGKTVECLKYLFAQEIQKEIAITVYMTDDGSTDGTSKAVKELFPQVIIIKGDGSLFWNRGMYAAWNRSVQDRRYDYYLWLNDDTKTYPFMLKQLLEASVSKLDKAIIVGPTVDAKGHNVHTYGGRKGKLLVPMNGILQKCDSFNGNIVLIPSSVFKSVGFNDPFFQHSLGDLDYGLRATTYGIGIWQLGNPVGECNRHERIMRWCDPQVRLRERWQALYSPTGYPPKEVFHFYMRHYGVVVALIHVIATYVRCILPLVWVKMNKANWI